MPKPEDLHANSEQRSCEQKSLIQFERMTRRNATALLIER